MKLRLSLLLLLIVTCDCVFGHTAGEGGQPAVNPPPVTHPAPAPAPAPAPVPVPPPVTHPATTPVTHPPITPQTHANTINAKTAVLTKPATVTNILPVPVTRMTEKPVTISSVIPVTAPVTVTVPATQPRPVPVPVPVPATPRVNRTITHSVSASTFQSATTGGLFAPGAVGGRVWRINNVNGQWVPGVLVVNQGDRVVWNWDNMNNVESIGTDPRRYLRRLDDQLSGRGRAGRGRGRNSGLDTGCDSQRGRNNFCSGSPTSNGTFSTVIGQNSDPIFYASRTRPENLGVIIVRNSRGQGRGQGGAGGGGYYYSDASKTNAGYSLMALASALLSFYLFRM